MFKRRDLSNDQSTSRTYVTVIHS